jgi:mycothiol system anti-sigma-R factor
MTNLECFINEEELYLFLDSELSVTRKTALDNHLNICRDCSTRFLVVQNIRDAVRNSCRTLTAPESLKLKILRELLENSSASHQGLLEKIKLLMRGRPLVPIGIAFSLIVIFVSAIYMRPQSSPRAIKLVGTMVHEHNEYIENFNQGIGIKSADPAEITRWITDRGITTVSLPQNFDLPLYGACTINEMGRQITCLFFDQGDSRVTLFITADELIQMDGLNIQKTGDMLLYCGSSNDDNYIAWKDNGKFCVLVGKLPQTSLIKMAEELI